MIRKKLVIAQVFAAVSLLAVPAHGFAAAIPTLPAGYENFTPDVDYASLIGDAVRGSTNMSCTVNSSNVSAFPQGSAFNPGEVQSDFIKGAAFLGALNDSSKEVITGCAVAVSIPKATYPTTGTVTNAALEQLVGTSSGTFSLNCDLDSSFQANATVRFGGKVPGKFDVVVTGADKEIPFNCSLAVTFGESTLNGTVRGAARIVDPATAGVCDGTETISCAPIGLTDAVVTITSSTGKFGGLTGTGTYSFTDSFSLKFIDSQMSSLPISKSSVRRASVHKSSGASEALSIQLSSKKKSSTAILRPVGSTISLNEKIYVAGTAKASCTLTAKAGKKSTKIATFKLNSSGQGSAKAFTSKAAKAIGAKKKSTVTVIASCKGLDKKTTTSTKKVKYLG